MSQANRLKLRKSRELQRKQKYKHGETKKTGSAKRGYRTLYWNQKTGSWQSTKPSPLVKKVEVEKVKPKTRAEKLKEGMATWNTKKGNEAYGSKLDGSKMVNKKDTPKTEVKKKDTPKTEVKKTDTNNNKLKINPEKKVEKKKDPLANYRRGPGTKLGKDTRITKKLKKAGFTEDRLAKLRKKHAEFKAKRKKKKK